MRRELPRLEVADREPGREVDGPGNRQADERHEGAELPPLAEERRLEDPVRMLEGLVVPVEPTARFRGRGEQPQKDGAKQRVVLARMRAGVRAGEDRGCGLARELVEGEARIVTRSGEPIRDPR